MNAVEPLRFAAPRLASRLLALLAPPPEGDVDAPPEARWLAEQAALAAPPADLQRCLDDWRRDPPPADDARLHRLADVMALADSERIALALCLAADTDLVAGRAIAWLQAPLRDARPSLGLVACLDGQRGVPAAASLAALLDGAALASGLLALDATAGGALLDAHLRLPLPLLVALAGGDGRWPGVALADDAHLPPLAASIEGEALSRAAAVAGGAALAVRSGHPREARAACAAVARALGRRAAFFAADIDPRALAGLGPWLLLHDAIPVACAEPVPGERRALPQAAVFQADRHGPARLPVLVASGLEGSWQTCDGEPIADWRVALPCAAEREALWLRHADDISRLDAATGRRLARALRHSSARIDELRRQADALRRAEGAAELHERHAVAAARTAWAGALGAMATPLSDDIGDDALVLPEPLRAELHALAARCVAREGLADALGPAARARYRPGVRALLVGPSGTGKTLACGWLATRLGKPLFRVDLASVTSKYIGETEKNLGELFARAEDAEVVLLFDEADALFGKRTEVKEANDRYANQQTNYLLQRIEAFDGIALLTSNSRTRFDAAFTRRLDAIVEFPLAGPAERHALWVAHLGGAHRLDVASLNRLAAGCELAGGHIRNVVLSARATAGAEAAIGWDALVAALAAEYRKLGRPLPAGLGGGRPSG